MLKYIVRHDYTPKVILQKLEEQRKMNSLKNSAIIYNRVRDSGNMDMVTVMDMVIQKTKRGVKKAGAIFLKGNKG